MKRKIIDERGRLFGKISVIDILVVLMALALLAVVWFRFFSGDEVIGRFSEKETFTYVIRVDGIRQYTLDAIKEGDVLYDNDNETVLGTVTKVERVPAERYYATVDGQYVMGYQPERYDMFLTVEAEGIVKDGLCYASRTFEINRNREIYYHTKYLVGYGIVWSIGTEDAQ